MIKNNILYVKNEVTKPSKNFSKIEQFNFLNINGIDANMYIIKKNMSKFNPYIWKTYV